MINNHLHILHLPPNTSKKKVNEVAKVRYKNLMKELDGQGIVDYTIIENAYDPKNTKRIIHLGHRRIVELAKKQGMSSVVIAEDDVIFTSPNSFAYFIGSIPKEYDLYCGCFYAGTLKDNRIMAGASGILTLYSIHSRFYDTFLSLNTDTHLDRELGAISWKHEFYVCNPMVVQQRGGYSFNLHKSMRYNSYHAKYKFMQ